MLIDVDWIVVFFALLTLYYGFLYLLSGRRIKVRHRDLDGFGFVVLIPACDEASVIVETVWRAAILPGRHHIVVIDDGSTDGTAESVAPLVGGSVHLYVRRPPDARRGKGQALNAGFTWALDHVNEWFPDLAPDRVVVTVLDADGYLDEGVFAAVTAQLDADSSIGGLQVPVSIQGANNHLLLLLQDIEFMGFSFFVQKARHWFSSVGMGGNGQFVRLSALLSLGLSPWSSALSEDLDLGIRLLLHGYRLRFCPAGCVHQQGLTSLPRLLRQRTRWIQGHYQAWRHLGNLWRSDLPMIVKLDNSLYLLLVAVVWVVVLNAAIGILAVSGIVHTTSALLPYLTGISPQLAHAFQVAVSFGMEAMFLATYAGRRSSMVQWYLWPAIVLVFALYSWIWAYASVAAMVRILNGRRNWVKTERETFGRRQARRQVSTRRSGL